MIKAFLEKSKINRIIANFGTSFFKSVITALLGLLVTPFIVSYVGDESYGIYKLIFDWLSNVWLFDLGVSGAFLALGAKHLRSERSKEFLYEGFFRHIRILPLLALGCLIFYFTLLSLIKFESVTKETFTIGYIIVSFTFVLFPLNVCRQYFEILEKSSLINVISSFQMVLTNVLSFIASILGFGLIGLCFSYFFGVAVNYLLILRSFYKEEGFFPYKKGKIRESLFKRDFKSNTSDSFKISLSQKVSFLADNSIIAYFYSPSLVTSFFISGRLASLFQNQLQGLTFSIWASLIEFWNSDNKDLFRKRLYETLNLSFLISNFFLLIVFLLNKNFISLWIGESYYLGEDFNIVLSLLMVVNVYNFFYGHILSGTGFLKKQSNMYLVLGLGNLILSVIFTYKISYIGPLLASLITMGILSLYQFFLMNRLYGLSKNKLIKIFGKNVIVTLALGGAFSSIQKTFFVEGWFHLFLFGLLYGVIYFLISFYVLFSSSEREVWKKRIYSLLGKIKS